MRRPYVQWLIAIVLTLTSAIWQRTTGPTYPAKGQVRLGGQEIALRLQRSNSVTGRQAVTVTVADAAVTGFVDWRRFPTGDPWSTLPMVRKGDTLETAIPPAPEPLMPMAGKLEFRVRLSKGGDEVSFPEPPAVTRFKGDVPAWILIPHVAAMFFGMLFSTRAAMAAIFGGDTRTWGLLTVALLLCGGLVLGPIVQKLAFGAYWTGIPWGYDLTDNKTLIAGAAWILAAIQFRGGRKARVAVVIATIVTMAVFAIPHSVWGSEARW
ncbi:MAG TPA: hypothetical protein VF332_11635 [Vicinamibacterales bacterium]